VRVVDLSARGTAGLFSLVTTIVPSTQTGHPKRPDTQAETDACRRKAPSPNNEACRWRQSFW
jgi:hypothetical protein